MKDLLVALNQVPCVQGSMVITDDGIMVAAALGDGLDEDTVAALSSSLVMTLKRSLKPFCEEIPDEIVLTASEGKLVFLGLGPRKAQKVSPKTKQISISPRAVGPSQS